MVLLGAGAVERLGGADEAPLSPVDGTRLPDCHAGGLDGEVERSGVEEQLEFPLATDLGEEGLAGQMTPAQIDQAQRLAREWKPKAE